MTKKCFLKKGGKKYPCLLTVVQVYYPATTAARRSHITLVLLKIIVYRVRSALNAPEDSGKHTYKLLPACLLHIVTKPFWPAISKQGGQEYYIYTCQVKDAQRKPKNVVLNTGVS